MSRGGFLAFMNEALSETKVESLHWSDLPNTGSLPPCSARRQDDRPWRVFSNVTKPDEAAECKTQTERKKFKMMHGMGSRPGAVDCPSINLRFSRGALAPAPA